MALDPQRILRRALFALGQQELDLVKQRIGSRALRAAVQLIVDESEERADLFIPHYWAVYYHDGRGRVSPVSARKLVFFDNPSEDPRLRGRRYPVRESQVKRLTRRQYEEGLRINRERQARGQRPFMFVVDSVGPSRPRPFFVQLEQGAASRADPIVHREFERELLRQLDEDPITRSETRRATFRLR